MTTISLKTTPTSNKQEDQALCHPFRVVSFMNEENLSSPEKSSCNKKRDIHGNPKRSNECIVSSTNDVRNSTKEEDDEVLSALSDSISMPLDYRIDWNKSSDYEKDIIQSVKSLDYDDDRDKYLRKSNTKQELFPAHAITIDDSVDPFEGDDEERDNNDCFSDEVPLVISTDNYQNIWHDTYLFDERENDDFNNQYTKKMRLS